MKGVCEGGERERVKECVCERDSVRERENIIPDLGGLFSVPSTILQVDPSPPHTPQMSWCFVELIFPSQPVV